MSDVSPASLPSVSVPEAKPMLDAMTRQRLGQQLQAMYEPVIDEAIDPRLAEILRQLDRDRKVRS